MSETHPSICRIARLLPDPRSRWRTGGPSKVTGDPGKTLFQGYTCPKGRALPELHTTRTRLLHSLKRGATAPRAIASRTGDGRDRRAGCSAIVAEHGPRAVAIYIGTSALPYPASGGWRAPGCGRSASPMFFTPEHDRSAGQADRHGAARRLAGGRARPFEEADTWLLVGMNPVISKCDGVPAQNPARKLKDAVGAA